MSEADEALEWVEYAEEDLILAKGALRRSRLCTAKNITDEISTLFC